MNQTDARQDRDRWLMSKRSASTMRRVTAVTKSGLLPLGLNVTVMPFLYFCKRVLHPIVSKAKVCPLGVSRRPYKCPCGAGSMY